MVRCYQTIFIDLRLDSYVLISGHTFINLWRAVAAKNITTFVYIKQLFCVCYLQLLCLLKYKIVHVEY